jgi:4-hydroxybenzoate polyprenyltransferase
MTDPEAKAAGQPLRDVARLLRPQQWYKNGLVLAGAVFSGQVFAPAGRPAWIGVALYCLLSSGVYALNDAADAAADARHPVKRRRPVAAGRIPRSVAVVVGAILLGTALAGGWILHHGFFWTEVAYVLLQLLYIGVLRHKFLLDLASISGGFFLRSLAGVLLVAVPLSPWLFLCTLFMAVFLGLGKRRRELTLLGAGAASHRSTLDVYTLPFLQQATTVTATALLVSYSLYTFFHAKVAMMATIPFVIYGLFRYVHLVEDRGLGGEPEAIFRDVPSLVNLLLWMASVVAILYFLPQAWQDEVQRLVFGDAPAGFSSRPQ